MLNNVTYIFKSANSMHKAIDVLTENFPTTGYALDDGWNGKTLRVVFDSRGAAEVFSDLLKEKRYKFDVK